MPSLRSSGKILGDSVSLRGLAQKYKVPKPWTVGKLLKALGIGGSSELAFQFGVHNLPFPNFSDGVPDWDTFLETFGSREVYSQMFNPIYGEPVSVLAFYELYKHYLKGSTNGGLATGFCTSLASLVADNFWTGVESHTIAKASVHKRLTAVHGKLLSKESLLHFHDQGVEGLARIERSCREIETIFLRGCTRQSAPLLFFIPAGEVWNDQYLDRLNRAHCVMPYRFSYPAGHPGPQLAADGKLTVSDLDGVQLYVWDCNAPDDDQRKLEFFTNGDHLAYRYSNSDLDSGNGFTLGMMTNGAYMLADHDLPFKGPHGPVPFLLDFLLSPADLQITNAAGQRTGRFGDRIYAEIPGSLPCYLVPRTYLLPTNSVLERRIVGNGSGQYTFNSLTPNGDSVVLQGVNTVAGQTDLLQLSPDQTELRFVPAGAQRFKLTVARWVGEEIRGMAISGIGTGHGAEFRFATSPEFGFANLLSTGAASKVSIQQLRIDRHGLFSRQLQPVAALSTNTDLHFDDLDWSSPKLV